MESLKQKSRPLPRDPVGGNQCSFGRQLSVHEERIRENFDLFDFAWGEDKMRRLAGLDAAVPMIGNPEDPNLVEAAMKW